MGAAGRSLRSTVGREATTFGFSILVTVTFGVVHRHHGSPEDWELLLYALGAVASFTLLEGVLSRGFRSPMPQHRTDVVAFGTALNVLSVAAGIGIAILVAKAIPTSAAWLVTPFAAATVYLLVESVEEALGERFQAARGNPHAADVEP